MRKTLKTLLLALLVVCTVCVLTVMVGAEGETPATEGYVRLYESDKTTAAVHADDTNYLMWKVESVGTDNVLTIFLESKDGATKSETTLTFNTDPGWNNEDWNATKIPWFHHLSNVTKVVIEAPITAINQDYAFDMLKNVHTFVIPSDKVIAISGNMMFANMNALTKFGPEGTADNTLDFRNINGWSGQCFENTSVKKTITLLCPYATAFPSINAKFFSDSTTVTIKALEGSPAYTTALEVKSYGESEPNPSPFANVINVEPYDTTGLVVEGVTSDGDAKWALDLGTKTLTVEKAADGWKEFRVHDSAWQNFVAGWKNYIETIKIDSFSKLTLNGEANGLFNNGSDTLKTIIFEKNQRIWKSHYWANRAFFRGLTALTTIDFVDDINDISGVEYGSVDFTGHKAYSDDGADNTNFLKNAFNGDAAVTRVVLPTDALITDVFATTFEGCTALTDVVIGENITTIEDGAFANWTNGTDGYANLTVTFTEDTDAAKELEKLEGGKLTVVVPTAATRGQVDGDATNENDLVWNLDIATGKLTISGTSTSIVWVDGKTAGWDGTINNWNFSMIPWYADYNTVITEVEITAPITAIPGGAFGSLENLEKITVPESCISVGTSAFVNCKSLKTLGVSGRVIDNVIDFRNFTGTNEIQIFDNALNGEVTIYLPKNEVVKNDVFGDQWGNITAHFVVYPGSASETQVYNMINNRGSRVYGTFTYSYYTEAQDKAFYDEYMSTISSTYKNGDGYTYHNFDIATGVVTVTTSGSQAWDTHMNQTGWKTMKTTWKYAIKQIRLETTGAKLTFSWAWSELAGFPELEAILFNPTRMQCVGSYLLANNPKLATIGTASNAVKGTYNLSTWNDVNNGGLAGAISEGMFAGNTAFDTLVLPANANKDYKIISIGKNAFNGCTGLRTIKIPANCTIESVDSTAFTGLTEPVKIINEMSDATLAEAIRKLLPDGSYIYKAPSSEGAGLAKGITFDAWKVRVKGYNGLRGVFYFDNSVTKTNEENGWTLVEYGALLTTSAKKNVLGATVYYDGTASSVDSHVKYWPIYKDGVVSGKTLKGDDVEKENATYFAVSVTKYNKNYTTDVYMAGYEIWKNSEGQSVIKYTDYANEAYKDTSIYDISMSMYMAGVINSAIDAEDIVWNTLKAGGALTLTADTDYAKTNAQVAAGAENLKDLNGVEFGDTFTFVDVPGVNVARNSEKTSISFSANDVRISIFAHPEKAGKYVLIYGAKDGTTVQLPTVIDPWTAATRVLLQFSNEWIGTGYTVANALPNPILTKNILGNIDYIVLDKGVTNTNSMCFFGIKATRLVYSDDLVEIADTTFQSGGDALTTIFKAGTEPVEGRFDLHYITKVNLAWTFNSCVYAKEIWLPENIGTSLGSETFQNCYRAVAIWCGDISNRQKNVANFGNTGITSLGKSIFNYNKTTGTNPSALTKVILPNGVSYTDASWGSSNITEVENLAAVESASGYSMIVVK